MLPVQAIIALSSIAVGAPNIFSRGIAKKQPMLAPPKSAKYIFEISLEYSLNNKDVTRPPKKKGKEDKRKATDKIRVVLTSNVRKIFAGILILKSSRGAIIAVNAKIRVSVDNCSDNLFFLNQVGNNWTQSPPRPNPNIATEITKKAKWYHKHTENTRVSKISDINKLQQTTNNPMYTKILGRFNILYFLLLVCGVRIYPT